MIKRYAVLGIIIALVISIATIGCSGGSSESGPTATQSPTQTAAPTAEPTGEPGETGGLPENYKFFMEWSDSEGHSGEMQYWVKGEKWNTAWSTTYEGTETEVMWIYDGQFAYMYMPDLNQVYKVDNPGAAYAQEFEDGYWGDASDAAILAGFQAACSGTASNDGPEDVNGTSCTKFTCDFADDSVSSYWIADSGWLVKNEVISAEGYTYTMQYSNIDLNPTIDDSMFDIDEMAPGVPITEV